MPHPLLKLALATALSGLSFSAPWLILILSRQTEAAQTDTSGKDIHGHGKVNSAPYLPVLDNHQQEHSHKTHKH